MIQYNDNELLYLISENDEIALDILIEKYQPLIKNRLIKFKIKQTNFEDFYQECLMTFHKCIQKYREDKKIAFATYLDISIKYCIQSMLQREKDYFYGVTLVSIEDIDYIGKETTDNFVNQKTEYDFKKLSAYEEKVMGYLNEGYNIEYISKELNRKSRSIYNTISRIKTKMTKKEKVNPQKENKNPNTLSNLERKVYDKYLQGFKAQEISYLLGTDITSIYNALKRAKNKMK